MGNCMLGQEINCDVVFVSSFEFRSRIRKWGF